MPIWVYILQSVATDRYYCGQTSHLERRLEQHNDPLYQLSKTTKRFDGPWKLVWSQQCLDRAEATRLEKLIKKRGMGRYLSDLNRQSPAPGGINH
jgi:putative endonuclease